MKAKDLMDAIGGISDRHIEKYAEVKPVKVNGGAEGEKTSAEKKRVRTAVIALAAALVLALAMIPVISKLSAGNKPGDITVDNSPNPSVTQEPVQATDTPAQKTDETDPTDQPSDTGEPPITTEAPSALPTSAATEPPYQVTEYRSEHESYVVFANAVLNGGSAEEAFSLDGGGVFFGVEDGKLTAYARAVIHDDPGNVHYELFDPIAYYPYELGERAAKSVSDYIRRNIDPEFAGDDDLQLFGYIGENYVIFTDEPFHGYQAYALFFTEDGENWTELDAMPQRLIQLTGGCVLSQNEAYLCFFDRSQMMFDDYTPRELTVYRTNDGGKTWKDVGLWIPEEYEGVIAPPAAALSPVFIGERGMIAVTYTTYNAENEGFDSRTSWFETDDGGMSWEFHLE